MPCCRARRLPVPPACCLLPHPSAALLTAPPPSLPWPCPTWSAPAGKEMQLLRAKALECVSLVGLAVGKERFG